MLAEVIFCDILQHLRLLCRLDSGFSILVYGCLVKKKTKEISESEKKEEIYVYWLFTGSKASPDLRKTPVLRSARSAHSNVLYL